MLSDFVSSSRLSRNTPDHFALLVRCRPRLLELQRLRQQLLQPLRRLERLEFLEAWDLRMLLATLKRGHNLAKRERGPLDLRLQRLVVELRVQSLGLDLRGWMQMGLMQMRKKCNNTRMDSDVINWARPAQCRSQTCPSPSPPLGPLPTIIA